MIDCELLRRLDTVWLVWCVLLVCKIFCVGDLTWRILLLYQVPLPWAGWGLKCKSLSLSLGSDGQPESGFAASSGLSIGSLITRGA